MRPARAIPAVLSCVAAMCVGSAAWPAASALAGGPKVQIIAPLSGSVTNDTSPAIAGTTDDPPTEEEFEEGLGDPVKIGISPLSGGEGQSLVSMPTADGAWSTQLQAPLTQGSYVVSAVQEDEGSGETGFSEATFAVDTTPPQISLSAPTNGSVSGGESVAVAGAAGTAAGDQQAVTIALYSGQQTSTPIETLGVQASNGVWSGTFGGLAPGSYTVQASERDAAGNVGMSAPATVTLDAAAPPSGPAASFSWVPAAPVVGESVLLVSSSTDSASPLTGFAWALSAAGSFAAGKPVLTTSFSTPGPHVVRLRVSDAAGRSSIATQTVPVSVHPTVLMQPFPIVRIAGSITGRGARIRLLTVQAPIAARITIRCRGGGCPTKSESRSAKASRKSKHKVAAVLMSFRHFARAYRAGARLEVLVVKPGQIGKYTIFKIRRYKLPIREDACIVAAGSKPIACASS
jgi:Bacterial Ig-like domain